MCNLLPSSTCPIISLSHPRLHWRNPSSEKHTRHAPHVCVCRWYLDMLSLFEWDLYCIRKENQDWRSCLFSGILSKVSSSDVDVPLDCACCRIRTEFNESRRDHSLLILRNDWWVSRVIVIIINSIRKEFSENELYLCPGTIRAVFVTMSVCVCRSHRTV